LTSPTYRYSPSFAFSYRYFRTPLLVWTVVSQYSFGSAGGFAASSTFGAGGTTSGSFGLSATYVFGTN